MVGVSVIGRYWHWYHSHDIEMSNPGTCGWFEHIYFHGRKGPMVMRMKRRDAKKIEGKEVGQEGHVTFH
jgi:hypothetical protein